MHKLVTFIRNTANRYPRVAWFLADIVRRSPRLNQYLAKTYGVRILPRPTEGDQPQGYRFGLVSSPDGLPADGRAILKQLVR
ncbi:hypothetical protein ThidrDRAFT_4324 [Thiorhodococcus drewsii AZ1]|uniref:Uncharacterized protein n=1 Tax=Thiorhodococcus drewsii AZ1 TaxID=765913 RepID=G2E7R1_9GAMM|nr:hypothetical protein [Thiorhodococcus drewsii]EGV27859.1 hypothetical protein ThidrDRAFT_4324 [Thiorhodococcus drewsii AZ1]